MSLMPTRKNVAISSLSTSIVEGQLVLTGGTVEQWDIEVSSTTSSIFVGFVSVDPPDPITQFFSAGGAFLNVFLATPTAGAEIWIDESIDGSGVTPSWHRSVTQGVTPGVLSKIGGFRINQSFVRVTFANNGAGLLIGDKGVRVTTL